MKKIAIWLLCAVLLSGCRSAALPTEPEETGTAPVTEPAVTIATEPVTESQPPVTEPAPTETVPPPTEPVQTEPVIDRADFEIARLDDSVRNESGEVIILFYYDRVVVGNGDSFPRINRMISDDAEEFIGRIDLDEMIDWATQMQISPEFPFLCNVTAEVVNNAGGIFSIMLTRDWFAGGVRNIDCYGMTFDLKNDRAMTLADLFPGESTGLVARLKDIVWDALDEEYGEIASEEMWDTLQAYETEDFLFYIRDGELILTFPTYTFGAGADGALTVPTGMYIEE